MSKGVTSKKRILDAAAQIAVEKGPKSLTLDNVARHCGMSKGGLMHHFPTKDALLTAMLESMLDMLVKDSEQVASQYADKLPITTIIRSRQQHHEKITISQAKILLVAASENTDLMAPMKTMMVERKKQIQQDPLTAEQSLLLWLAADGLTFQELLGISPFERTERQKLRTKLIEMAKSLEEPQSE